MPPLTFSAADIRDLAYNPQAHKRQRLRHAPGGGFGVPELWWRYQLLEAYHDADRAPEAIDSFLGVALAVDVGRRPGRRRGSPFSVQVRAEYSTRDRISGLTYVRTLDRTRPVPVTWRGHVLSLPGGLLFTSARESVVRLVWSEKALSFGRRGVTLVVAATLACLESRLDEPPAIIEVCHLRDREWRRYPARDLRSQWAKLDPSLTWAERRPEVPPAA